MTGVQTCALPILYLLLVGSRPQLIGFIRFGEPVPHGLSARPRVWVGPTKVSSSGTHMVAPEAYKPYVGGNSNRCGTWCQTCDYKV